MSLVTDTGNIEGTVADISGYFESIDRVLAPLIPLGSRVALFDFPYYDNVGDSAIWLGEERYLETRRARIVAVGSHDGPPLPALDESIIVLIQGGGNLGDLWPSHQRFRERVVANYPNNRVIQLPQSIHFNERNNFEACQQVFRGHPDFHLLVRDRSSLTIAGELHDGPCYLCPDMALALGRLPRTVQPGRPLFGLLRTDREKKVAVDGAAIDLAFGDWLDTTPTPLAQFRKRIEWLHARYPRRLRFLYPLKRRLYHALAAQQLRRGCDILGSGQVVITDRLHAHILCTLMGIPHVVLDNSYRKIGNFRDAWHTGDGICSEADTMGKALAEAKRLLSRHYG